MTAVARITAARGDGIGPEIMDATLRILSEAGAGLEVEWVELGLPVYERGITDGVDPESWAKLHDNRVLLKAPMTTPQGGGFTSLTVAIRKSLGLYANIRPSVAYHPFIQTKHPTMDVVIVRENEEDLYSGIEYRQTQQVTQALKLITRPGAERICRAAFNYARQNGRKRVTAMIKDNIMKISDGLFHRVFKEVAEDYPEIEADSLIIDIGAARLADTPERFDVIVTLNLYGDVLSDIAAQIAGSVGLAGSANIGDHFAMFEAIHGSAPDIAGKGIANPSGLLLGAVMMLVHLGQNETAARVHNAWLKTIEDGMHTADVFTRGLSVTRCDTAAFTDAVVARLGQKPEKLAPVSYHARNGAEAGPILLSKSRPEEKALVGVDVFFDWSEGRPADLAARLKGLAPEGLELVAIGNRGLKVWPDVEGDLFCVDHWRCRFIARGDRQGHAAIVALLERLAASGMDFIKTENLYTFDGRPGFSEGGDL